MLAIESMHSAPVRDRGEPAIRRATPADVAALTPMLVRAFMEDPVSVWACPPDGLRPRVLANLYRTRLHQMTGHCGVARPWPR